MKQTLFKLMILVCTGLVLTGCSKSSTSPKSDGPITADHDKDFDHQHKHQHSDANDHEHDHKAGFEGSHSHGHSHNHRHGDPLHGGRIVSVGHTHHKDGATHFHAEVMPLEDNTIRIHILTELTDGTSQDFPIEDKTIAAVIGKKGEESDAKNVEFTAVGEAESTSEFALTIPDSIVEGDAFTVVIPKVELGGHRQNFSFKVTRPGQQNDKTAEES